MPLSPPVDSPFRRIAITKPPRGWFHDIPLRLFEIYRRALVGLDFSVFEVEVEPFLAPDIGRINALLESLRAFEPDLAIGVPHGTYALLCRMPPQRSGWRRNLFVDVLEIPTICIWDHAPVQEADQLLGPLPNRPEDSTSGALAILRRALANPLMVHWSRDRGQTRIMQQLGFVRPDQVVQIGTPVLPGFAPPTTSAEASDGVAFIGNLYQEATKPAEPALERLQYDAITRSIRKSTALWDEIADGIAALSDGRRSALALDQDQTFFWRFAHQLIERTGQTHKRLHLLGAAGVPITVFGDFQQNAPDVPRNLHANAERFRFGPELAAAFASHAIIVDVLSSAFVDGYSFKPIIGFASGGFVLVDRKRDFVDAFGELGRAVSYADAEELAARIDRLLSNPRERREFGDAMREEIRAKHALVDVLGRVLQATAEKVGGARRRSAGGAAPRKQDSRPRFDLLPALQTHPYWREARVERGPNGVTITTGPEPWVYSAEIPIGEIPTTLRDPHVRLELVVEAGRIGVCAIHAQTGELISEQLVSATRHAVWLEIGLQHDRPARLIIRNTTDGASRARLHQALLCEGTVPDPA